MLIQELLVEDVEAMQAINRMSMRIIKFFNDNPRLVWSGSKVPLDKIIPEVFADKALETLRLSAEIQILPMSEFKMDAQGHYQLDMNHGSFYSQFQDPKTLKFDPDVAWNYARQDRQVADDPAKPSKLNDIIKAKHKLPVSLPAEVLTRSLEFSPPDKADAIPIQRRQRIVQRYSKEIFKTIAHELNHGYNALQGMDLDKTRDAVDKNRALAKFQNDFHMLADRANDPEFLNKYKRMFKVMPNVPKSVSKLYDVSLKAQNVREQIAIYERNLKTFELKLASLQGQEKLQAEKDIAAIKQVIQKEQSKLKSLLNTQEQLKTQVYKIGPDPKIPQNYEGDAYWASKTELNSRLQEVSIDLMDKARSGMSNADINNLIMKSFAAHGITQEFMDVSKMGQLYSGGPPFDRDDKMFFQKELNKLSPEFQKEAFKSASYSPEFKRYVNIAYTFIQREMANPTLQTDKKALGQRLKGLLLGIPQSEIDRTILPGAMDTARSAVGQAMTKGSPMRQNLAAAKKELVANTVELSKKLDTPGNLQKLQHAGKVLVTVGIVTEIYRGLDQILSLPKDMPDDQYYKEVEKIIAKLVAEFGLVYVAAIAGSWISGLALSAILPGFGTVAGAIVGFIAGGAAGYLALEFAGDSVRSIAEKIVQARHKLKVKEDLDRIKYLARIDKC